ncbi:MmgE/PrpD family protein [Antarctobacter sp.]|uniref:MmgE/PrpD family protein n=1 Tax=Antarctobacter sp. TaxID=1872577 RepID=UPI003A92CEDF
MHRDVSEYTATLPDFAQVYSAFSEALRFEDLPAEALAAARLNVADTLACSIAGVQTPGSAEMREIVAEWGGTGQAQVLWSDMRVPAPQAAWLNGIMAHACDYDDTHDKAILHAGISVLPAAIAAAEIAGRPVSGREFYTAVAAGLELMCRIGVATNIGLIQAGYIYSALLSYFGATVAAAKVLGLNAADTQNALGIAFTQASGTHQVTRDGALTKRMQPGFGARAALVAVTMARKNIRGAQGVFEGIDGLNRIYLQDELDSDILRAGLGETWHYVDLSYKPYPCCRMNHTAIDAALALREKPGFDLNAITAVTANINSQGNQAVGTPLDIRRAPGNVVQAQFSICYTIACALVQGRVGLSDFTPEAITRPEILAVAAKVTPVVDAELERSMGRNVTPARVEIEIGDKRLSEQVLEAKGNFKTPMTEAENRRKLEDCLTFGGFDPARADAFQKGVAGLQDSADVAADIRALSETVRG